MEEGASPPAPAPGSSSSSSDLPTRIVVSLLACSIVSWQLLETTKLPSAAGAHCCRMRGSLLQWWLLALMLLSVIEGILMTLTDLVLLARRDPGGTISAANMRQELTLTLAIGHADQIIVSLMIIGLGVSGWRSGVKYARVAVGLGATALFSRRLPAPLLLLSFLRIPACNPAHPVCNPAYPACNFVLLRLPAPLLLVGGVSCLQRSTRLQAELQAEPGAREAEGGCFSLRCALRPLLAVALLEALYSSIPPSQLEEGMRQAKRDGTLRPLAGAAGPDADTVLLLLDTMRPEEILDAAQQALGELVQFGVVLALGVSGHAHGLRHARLPIAAAFVPGLPVSFAVVFYFLLETRALAQGSQRGTLLPLHSGGQEPRIDHTL